MTSLLSCFINNYYPQRIRYLTLFLLFLFAVLFYLQPVIVMAEILPDNVTYNAGDVTGDGYSNEYEYFFCMDPTSATNPNKPYAHTVTVDTKDYAAVTYIGRTNGITYTFATSDDLIDWGAGYAAPGAKVTAMTPVGNGDGTENVTVYYNDDYSTVPKVFIRIKASDAL